MEPKRYPLSAVFREIFDSQSPLRAGLSFFEVVNLALYHPQLGYYQKKQERVGKGPETDFYTATTLGPIWYELIFDALENLLGKERAGKLHFVELGAEAYQPLPLTGLFLSHERIVLNNDLDSFKEPFVLFANEILDAQAFRQFRFFGGNWQEWGVFWNDTELWEAPLNKNDAKSLEILSAFEAQEGDICDLSTGAFRMVEQLLQHPYLEALLLFDYGKNLPQLIEDSPQGTARAYYNHTLDNSILEALGDKDITHHIAWDEVMKILSSRGFLPQLHSQESFFVKSSPNVLRKYLTSTGPEMFRERQALKTLLHPLYFGQKFQALYALKNQS